MTKPLTKLMQETLMDCHERELMNFEPSDAGSLPYAAGLIKRGLLRTQVYTTKTDKRIIAFYVTIAGKRYLSNLK